MNELELAELIIKTDQNLKPFDPADPSSEVFIAEHVWAAIVGHAQNVVSRAPPQKLAASSKPARLRALHGDLRADQVGALKMLVAKKAGFWKQAIRDLWNHSDRVQGEAESALYSLRNTHGLSWLSRARTEDFK